MRKFISRLFQAATGKTEEQLCREWSWHHFCTRSRLRAYLMVLRD